MCCFINAVCHGGVRGAPLIWGDRALAERRENCQAAVLTELPDPLDTSKAQSCSPLRLRPDPRRNDFGRLAATVKVAIVIAVAAIKTACPTML